MKPAHSLSLLLLGAAGIGVFIYWNFKRNEDTGGSPPAPRVPGLQSSPSPGVSKAAEVWPHRGAPEFKRMALERGQKWLAARGRDAGSLVAMWDVSGDEALLNEAAEKFPNDPRVCLAMIARAGEDAAKSMPWIERLMAAEPKNPEGYYLQAAALMASKDRAGALTALRAAASINAPRDNHLRERILTVREGVLASGAGTRDAAYLALAAPLANSTLYTPLNGLGQALKEEIAEAKASGSEDRLLEIAGLGLGLAGRFNDTAAGVVVDSMVASSLERMILKELSDDTEIGVTGKTAGQMKAEAAQRAQQLGGYLKQSKAGADLLENSPDAVISEYTDRFLLHGEMAARAWLFQQAEPKNTP